MAPVEQSSRASVRELFFAGYRAAIETVAWFPSLERALLEIRGSRALQVLGGLVSNAVDAVPEGRGAYTFMLGPKGRTVADFRMIPRPGFETAPPDGDEILWIDAAREALDPIRSHFRKYVPPIFATYEPLETRRLSIVGPLATDVARELVTGRLGPSAPDPGDLEPLGAMSVAGGLLVRREPIEGPGYDVYLDLADAPEVEAGLESFVSEAGGASASAAVWDVLRIEAGVPVLGSELTPDRLAQEAGQDERAISYEKGCYTGQEVVARIHYRGHVNRHLRGLRLFSADDPRADEPGADEDPADAEVVADIVEEGGSAPDPGLGEPGTNLIRAGRTVGTLTSITDSPRLGRIALGYVRREVEPGARLELASGDGAVARVVALPFTSW
ncbi:MAG: hypothetical protein MJB57_02030 [Gemmatimonadetes bacterium]|nr:hypothetical protein [Gemmatimonadota bacterium]